MKKKKKNTPVELKCEKRWSTSKYYYVFYRLKNKIPKKKTWFDKLFNIQRHKSEYKLLNKFTEIDNNTHNRNKPNIIYFK